MYAQRRNRQPLNCEDGNHNPIQPFHFAYHMHFQPIYPNNSTIRSTLETTTHRPPTKSIQFRMSLISSFDCMHPMRPKPLLSTSTLPNQHQSMRVMAFVPSSSIFCLIQPIHVNHRSPQLHSSSVHSYRQPISLFTLILSKMSRASVQHPTELSHLTWIVNPFPHKHLARAIQSTQVTLLHHPLSNKQFNL